MSDDTTPATNAVPDESDAADATALPNPIEASHEEPESEPAAETPGAEIEQAEEDTTPEADDEEAATGGTSDSPAADEDDPTEAEPAEVSSEHEEVDEASIAEADADAEGELAVASVDTHADDQSDNADDDQSDTAEDDEPSGPRFTDLGLRDELLRALRDLGFETPTPIQAEAIPVLLRGHDLLGQAATGTGKTAAFALPAIDGIDTSGEATPQVLILAPTRELAVQVADATADFGKHIGLRVCTVYGGTPIQKQLQALRRGVHVVVATPGRALDHLRRNSLRLDDVQTVVLDEADEMLDMGFAEDLEAILDATPADRQTVMFSATMPPRINAIAKAHQRDPIRIEIAREPLNETAARVRQTVYLVERRHKAAALGRVLDVEQPGSALVFCKTRGEVDELTVTMNNRGYRTEALHGGMDQHQRERVLGRLKDGTAQILIATDVAARGIDIDTLTHVVNYDVPPSPEQYVHRIGRVGRAGREGVAITIAEPRQRRLIHNIERLIGGKVPVSKLPTVADLKAKQVELTLGSVRAALGDDDLDDYEAMREALVAGTEAGGTVSERALLRAALKLIHTARGGALDTREIPDASERPKRDNDRGRDRDRGTRNDRDRGRDRNDRGRPERSPRDRRPAEGTGSVYIGAGKKANVRPGDLVGAIAGETDLVGSQIGPIRIAEYFSVVGVPDDDVERVIDALQNTTIKGKRPKIRRFVD